MSLCFKMVYTFWSFIITKDGWFSGLKLLQNEKACLESISSLKKKKKCFSKPWLRNHEQSCSFSNGSSQKSLQLTPRQMAGLLSTLLPPRIHLQANLPCGLSQLIRFCAPKQGDRSRGCNTLRQYFPFGLPAWLRPWWVEIQVETNMGSVQAFGFDLQENFVMCAREKQFKK